jgi:AmmeMemoRadiSam system protein A
VLAADLRAALLRLARGAIEARLRGARPPSLRDLPPGLEANGGAFVTLRRRSDHELRGCIGYVEPSQPLGEAVAAAAVAAATADGRFDPVTLAELPSLVLDVSVLGPAVPIQAQDVEVGRHGLVVQRGERRGLLLPQVPLEWGWDAATFLEQVCRKAGLPTSAWKEPGTSLLGFEAEVFSEES